MKNKEVVEHIKTIKSKKKYYNAKGRSITCKVCEFEFKHSSKEKRIIWIQEKWQCPKCKVLYCNKPKTERQLMELQDIYLNDPTQSKCMDKICKLVSLYTESMIKKRFSYYISCVDDLNYYRDKAVSFVIEDFFVEGKNYRIWGSWAGIIDKKIRQAIFEKNEKPIEILLQESCKSCRGIINVDYDFDDNNSLNTLIEDPGQTRYLEVFEHRYNRELFIKFFSELLRKFRQRYTSYEMSKLVYALYLRNLSNETKVLSFFKEWDNEGKWPLMKFTEIFKKELSFNRC